jgi:hypothetical protein
MIDLEEFLKIFKDAGFSKEMLVNFHRSIRRSVILSYAGRKGLSLLLKTDQKEQWPILKEIDNSQLGIYHGADPELLAAFIATIENQKKDGSWLTLRASAQKRAALYKTIFDFTPAEVESCRRMGKKFEALLVAKSKKCRLKLMIAIGGGVAAAGAVGAGAYVWWKRKDGGKSGG